MTDVIHIRGETEAINAYDAMGLLPMKESATSEELEVARTATYGYLDTEELLEDCQMPLTEVDPGYQAYLDSFAEVEAVGDLVSARIGLPVTVNGNDIRSAREAYDLGVSVGVLPPLEGEEGVRPMREVSPASPQDAETGAQLTGSQCPDCQGTGLMAGVLCEDCGGSGLTGVAEEPVEESASGDAQEQLAQRREQRRRQQQMEQEQMEEDDAAVGPYMDDLDDDDDDLESASSLNSGKKQRKPKSTATQQNADQTAPEPDNSYDRVMGPDDPMEESDGSRWRWSPATESGLAPDWMVLGFRGPDDPDFLAIQESDVAASNRTDGGVGLLKVCGLPTKD